MDPADLRARFPLLDRVAFLNAGTNGPLARDAAQAAAAELESALADGRAAPHFARRAQLQEALRAAYARRLGCDPVDVALTTSTSEGLGKVIAGLGIGAGDEVLTSDQEHPGLLGPLQAARERGARIRTAPLTRLAEAVGPSTTLVACSHVGWISGELADPRLADSRVPVVLDGAQGAGAIRVDVRALGCAAYAASGQKWMCGSDGTGMLYVSPAVAGRLAPIAPSYVSFAEPALGMDAPLKPGAARHDTPALPREAVALSLAAHDLLASAGWARVHQRARELAGRLAEALAASGRRVGPRGDTTLVAWEDPQPAATRERLAAAGVIVRELPNTPYLRASVGAWNDDSDLRRLLDALDARR